MPLKSMGIIPKGELVFLTLIFVFLMAGQAHGEGLKWSGFLTAGVVSSDQESYLDGITNRANFGYDSKLGLNLATKITPHVSFHGQMVAVHDAVYADWYFVFFQLNRQFGLILGRQKFQAWLYSDSIDVSHTYPWVRPPEDIYSLNPVLATDGATFQYSRELGESTFSAELVGGQIAGGGRALEARGTRVDSRHLYGGVITLRGDILTARTSYYDIDASIEAVGFSINRLSARFGEAGLGVNYANILFITEYVQLDSDIDQGEIDGAKSAAAAAAAAYGEAQAAIAQGENVSEGRLQQLLQTLSETATRAAIVEKDIVSARGWYYTLGYRFGNFLPHLTATKVTLPKDALAFGNQRTASFGVRYDFGFQSHIKVQGTMVDIEKGSSGFYDASLADARKPNYQAPTEDLRIYSASYSVIF